MSKAIFLLSVSVLFSVFAFAQTSLENQLNTMLSKPDYKHASIGINVVDLASDKNILNLNPNKLLIPASTMKLISSASALELLGADYRFETKIGTTGTLTSNGILNGNLVVIGGADPALGSEYFQDHYMDFLQNWARKIKTSGIKKVNGNLILDASVYDTERLPNTWIWGDIGNYYGVGPNAFTVYDNLFRITFKSPKKAGKLTEVINYYPKIEGLEINNEVLSDNTNSDNAYVFGGPFDKNRTIRGTIPRNRKAFTIKAAIHQPEEILVQELLVALANEGVFVSGKIEFKKVNPKQFEALFVQESPLLTQIAEVLNHESINLFAEHFLKQIAVEKNGNGNRTEAIKMVKEYWNENGISTEHLFMEDGSGLSHFNAVSPMFFTKLLSYMATNEAFKNSLPVAGEGTLKPFNTDLFPNTTLHAKSGSMTRVRCYAGYLTCDTGKTLVFSFMCNHFSGSHSVLIKEFERILHLLKTHY